MGILLRLAWRNLWRHKRRTWLTASAIAFVTVLMVFLITLQLGSYDLMVDSSLRIFTAQMQVQREGYLDKPQIRTIIPDAADARRASARGSGAARCRASRHAPRRSRWPRAARAATVCRSWGSNRSMSRACPPCRDLMKAGRYLTGRDAQEAVLGAPLAKNLNIQVGDELTLLGSAMDGSVAATIVPVVGIFESGMRDLDRVLVEMPLGTFQECSGWGRARTRSRCSRPTSRSLPQMHREVERLLPAAPELVVLDWDRLIPGLKQIIEADWTIDWFIYVALILVVTLSILNTFIMSVLERTREFGIMLALGATPLRIGTLVFAETALLALIGLGIGIGIGFGIAAWLSVHGFTYPGLEEFMGQYGLPALIYPKLSAKAILIGPAVILGFILVAALYPALRIRKLQPVEAIHVA